MARALVRVVCANSYRELRAWQQFEDFDRAIDAAMKYANGLRRYLQNTPTPKERLDYGPKARTKHEST